MDDIPILDKKEDCKRKALTCIGHTIAVMLAMLATLAVAGGLAFYWAAIIPDIGYTWVRFIQYAFADKETIGEKSK